MISFNSHSAIGFVGAGTVGKSLTLALSARGYNVVAVVSRTRASAQELAHLGKGVTAYETVAEAAGASEVVFITTPDDTIGAVVSAIPWRPGQAAVHCSGVSSLDLLEPARTRGASVGAIHPLQAFASVANGVKSIPGTTFGIEGDDAMKAYLKQMALDIGGLPIFLRPEDKVLYHLSGAMMGGLLAGLAAVAGQLWDHIGLSRAEGVRALMPMMRHVSYNLETSGIPEGLAGPYARGDVGTIRKHLQTLMARAPDVLPLYCHLALAGLPFALEKGTLSPERAEEVRDLVNSYLLKAHR